MTDKNLPQMVKEIIDERDALLKAVSELRYRHEEAMAILRDDPDAANAATAAWDVLNEGVPKTEDDDFGAVSNAEMQAFKPIFQAPEGWRD